MNVRPLLPADFARLEQEGGCTRQYGRNVRRWLDDGYVKAPDCYVFENNGALLGGVCFCDDTKEEREILDFALTEIIPKGHELLTNAVQLAAGPETRKISYNLYNDTEQFTGIQNLFGEAGFTVEQEKLRYLYEGPPPPPSGVLRFKSVAETGEALFTQAVEAVTVGTLDRLMAADAARLGGSRAAQEYVDSLKKIDFNPDWWRLGYSGDELVGLILPQRFSETLGGINYAGVLPKYRGQGYGRSLLAEGTRILTENGAKEICADIDAANYPMANALEHLGYVFRMKEVVLANNYIAATE
jgi:ribosomal protein S18 acetylase RimI-like enzyme